MVWIVLPKARIPSEVISWKVIFLMKLSKFTPLYALDNQVFGSVLVREVYDFLRIFQYDDTAVR